MNKLVMLAALTLMTSFWIATGSGTGAPTVEAQPTTQAVTCQTLIECSRCSTNLIPRGNQNLAVTTCSDGTSRTVPTGRCGDPCF